MHCDTGRCGGHTIHALRRTSDGSKDQSNIGFEKQLWDAAGVLWGHIPAAEYRKVIIGLIFLRYISAAFDRRHQELVDEGEGFEDDRDAYMMDNVFYVPESARWSTIAAAAHTPEIGTVIDDAMRAIEADNKSLKDVLPKNYASPDLDKLVLGDVVDIFTNRIDMSDTETSEDLLGRTYEYCIAQFAEKEGVGGGEFYTPSSVVRTLVSILRPFADCRVYDPCCGSGGMFVQSAPVHQGALRQTRRHLRLRTGGKCRHVEDGKDEYGYLRDRCELRPASGGYIHQ